MRITCSCKRDESSLITRDDPACAVHALAWPDEFAWLPRQLVQDGLLAAADPIMVTSTAGRP